MKVNQAAKRRKILTSCHIFHTISTMPIPHMLPPKTMHRFSLLARISTAFSKTLPLQLLLPVRRPASLASNPMLAKSNANKGLSLFLTLHAVPFSNGICPQKKSTPTP